ncbi:MAG: tetratricopeptide repeat protein [Treponema sp.]|nr:tetratricopeptide repeat protein [Treponema sp.]
MKKLVAAASAAIVLVSLLACATAGGVGGGLSLQEAIGQTAESIARDIPTGSRVAVVTFDSASNNLSAFIMDELVGELITRGVEVADRRNLGLIEHEMNLSLGGSVCDETALRLGRYQAARVVITGQLLALGNTSRLAVYALYAETAMVVSLPRFDVRNDSSFQNMVVQLEGQPARTPTHVPDETVQPQTAGAYLDRGLFFFVRMEFDIAMMDFTEALRLDPNLAAAHYWRGVIYNNRTGPFFRQRGYPFEENANRAIAEFTEAIRLNPSWIDAFSSRSHVHWSLGDYDSALADANQMIRLAPNDPQGLMLRGSLRMSQGNYVQARLDFSNATHLDPDSWRAWSSLAGAHRAMGNNDGRIEAYTQLIRLYPNHPNWYSNRAFLHLEMRNFDYAIADITQIIRLWPDEDDESLAFFYRQIEWARMGIGSPVPRSSWPWPFF